MVDAFILEARLNCERWGCVIGKHALTEFTEAGALFYKSGKESRTKGVAITLKDNTLRIKGSLHKFYYWKTEGRADNSGVFTMSQMCQALEMLEAFIGVPIIEGGVFRSYEVGLNIRTSQDAREYIKEIESIDNANAPEMIEDATQKKYRQKTTRKDKDRKKYFKAYDKKEEVRVKQGGRLIENTLRIETAYKRQRKPVKELINKRKSIADKFRADWLNLHFVREYEVAKGVHGTQAQKARMLMELGETEYIRTINEWMECRKITLKQHRTHREFARDFEKKHRGKIILKQSAREAEIKHAINTANLL